VVAVKACRNLTRSIAKATKAAQARDRVHRVLQARAKRDDASAHATDGNIGRENRGGKPTSHQAIVFDVRDDWLTDVPVAKGEIYAVEVFLKESFEQVVKLSSKGRRVRLMRRTYDD